MVLRNARPFRAPVPPDVHAARAAGIALPLALLALAMIYLLAAGGFLVSGLDLRISEHHRAAVEAFYAADGALQTSLGTLSEGYASPVTGSYPGWRIRVEAAPLLELPGGDLLLRLQARAVTERPGPFTAREVGTAALRAGPADPGAALIALAGAGAPAPDDVVISGEDASSPPCSDLGAAVAGALVIEGSATELAGARLEGSPPLLEVEAVQSAGAAARLAWAAPTAGGQGDETGTDGGGAPPGELRLLSASPSTLQASDSGRGVLWASGNLRLGPGFEWEGLVVAGGALEAAEAVRIHGGAVAGLNALSGAPSAPSRFEGGVEIRRASCAISAALSLLPLRTVALPGSWSEAF